MNRTFRRNAFVIGLVVAAIVAGAVIGDVWFRGYWGGGLGGGLGALALMYSGKLFDRIWPMPMEGWTE